MGIEIGDFDCQCIKKIIASQYIKSKNLLDSMTDFILPNPEFEAQIYYLAHQEGGRQNPIYSGYRGQFYYDCKNWDTAQQFIDKSLCNPGETVKSLMQTTNQTNHIGKLFVNKAFEIREGSKIVGVGKITKLLFKEFQKKDLFNYEKKIIERILLVNQFGIKSVNDLDGVKSTYFNKETYPSVVSLIKQNKWYVIDDNNNSIRAKNLEEYLYIEAFSDQKGRKYITTIYDNDLLWQDPEILDIFELP